MTCSLQARVVYPVDRPPIEHGVVTVDEDRIVAVGTKPEGGQPIDLGDVALLPGLVNAHTHLEFSNLRRPLGEPGITLPAWIRPVIAYRAQHGTFAASSILRGLVESLHSGVTTAGEIMQGFAIEPAGAAAEENILTLLLEVIGFSRARAESAFAAAVERLDKLSGRLKAPVGICPHAPYSVSPVLFQQLIDLAKERGLLVATHLAESEEELQFLCDGTGPFRELLEERSMWDAEAVPRGSRPLDYLRALADAPRALVIHGNYFDTEERSFLAAHADRMSLVYCPRTHAYFAHSPYPLAELLALGVRVALGTDSRASNPDLNLLAEMRYVARTFPALDPHAVLRMGTLAGAEALGRDTEVGSIMSGKLANLVAIPLPADACGGAEDLLTALLDAEDAVATVWLRGTKQP